LISPRQSVRHKKITLLRQGDFFAVKRLLLRPQEQGEQAQRRGETAAAMAAYARLMAQNPPRVGKTLPGHEATDNWWYYAVPNEELTDVTYVRSGAWAKGDNLEWDTLTEEEKANIIQEILASFATVSEQDAAAVFSGYVFSTTD